MIQETTDRTWNAFMSGIMLGVVILLPLGIWAGETVKVKQLDAYLEGRETQSYADQLAVCRERVALLDSLQVSGDYSEVGE